MPQANAARIGWDNLADRGAVTASSFAIATPPPVLQSPHVARRWRGVAGAAEYLTIDLFAVKPVDCVALFGLNLSAAGLTRIRLSAGDSSALDGAAYDSDPAGPVAGRVNPRWPALIHLLPAPVMARYVRIDLQEPGAAFIEAGRIFVGATTQFETNFAYGWSRGYVDRSRTTESRGGQTYVDRDNSYRVLELQFGFVEAAERWGVIEDVDQFNGKHTDVLLITDPTSSELGRDSVWGLMEDVTPVSQPNLDLYSKTYRIKERL